MPEAYDSPRVSGPMDPDPDTLAGSVSPVGAYRIDPAVHERFVEATFGSDVFRTGVGEPAHPSFGHVASHCGMGWSFDDLLEVIGARPEDAVVFGRGTFDFPEPLWVGATYEVRSSVTDVRRRQGRRIGIFDAVTVTHLLDPRDGGSRITTTETYIVRRPGAVPTAGGRPRASSRTDDRVLDHLGQVGPVRLEDIMEVMKLMQDTNPVHLDRELARTAGYRGVVNQGPANLAYLFAALARRRGHVDDLRRAAFEFNATVTEGDCLDILADWHEDRVETGLWLADGMCAAACHCWFG